MTKIKPEGHLCSFKIDNLFESYTSDKREISLQLQQEPGENYNQINLCQRHQVYAEMYR